MLDGRRGIFDEHAAAIARFGIAICNRQTVQRGIGVQPDAPMRTLAVNGCDMGFPIPLVRVRFSAVKPAEELYSFGNLKGLGDDVGPLLNSYLIMILCQVDGLLNRIQSRLPAAAVARVRDLGIHLDDAAVQPRHQNQDPESKTQCSFHNSSPFKKSFLSKKEKKLEPIASETEACRLSQGRHAKIILHFIHPGLRPSLPDP